MSLGKIVTALQDTVGSFIGVLAFGRTGPYTSYEGVTNRIIPGNWKLSLPYSFRVNGVSSSLLGAKSPVSGLFNVLGQPGGGGLFDEFFLPVNPQGITQDENFSITVTPTQRGLIAEHNGVVFKDLVIAGTTGQRPFADQSGYETFQQLRNYFRSYAQLKKSPGQRHAQLMFLNRKDNEFLIVEPVKFNMKRDSNSPFLYNYNIILRVLGARPTIPTGGILGDFFDRIDSIVQTATDYIQRVRFIFQRSTQLLKTIEREFVTTLLEPIEIAGLAFKSILGLPYAFIDLPTNIINQLSDRTMQVFLDNAKQLKKDGDARFATLTLPIDTKKEVKQFGPQALINLPPDAKAALDISPFSIDENNLLQVAIDDSLSKSKKFYEDLASENIRIRDNAAEHFGVGDPAYDSFIGRTSTLSVDPDRKPSSEEVELLFAFDLANRAMMLILSTELLFKDTLQTYVDQVRVNYDDTLQLLDMQSVDEIVLPANTTLEDLASEFLGTAERWIDIAIANNLESPYIQEGSTNPKVKKSGDRIFIPRQIAPERSNIPKTNTIRISQDLTETERNLGVDVKVDKNFNFILNNINDVDLVASGANAGQAVILKIALEKGSLKYHPQIGVGLNIGEKIRNGMDVRDDLIRSILSDQRFTGIKNMSFFTQGSTIRIDLELTVKHLLTPVPLTLVV